MPEIRASLDWAQIGETATLQPDDRKGQTMIVTLPSADL